MTQFQNVMHIHLRQQAPGKGHLPSWEVGVSKEIQQAIREACPGVIINHTTGTSGPHYQGALDCVRETRPEISACNAGSLNYLKVKADNTWAWPPMMFDNAVEKVQDYLDVMKVAGTIPEFECFDVGIVRCVGMAIVTEAAAARRGKPIEKEKLEAMKAQITGVFDGQMDVFSTSARVLDDGVIDPRDTRAVLAEVLAICREADARTPQRML